MSTPVDPFTERMARAQDEALDDRALRDQVRARLLSGASPRANRSERGLVLVGFGATAAVAAAAALFVVFSGPTDLTAHHGGVQLAVGAWIDAGEAEATLNFSDGTTVVVEQGSTARLAKLDANGASLQLERGKLDLDVVHTGDADWEVQAGPFTVDVTGTAFQTEWSPDGEVFRIQMREGSVLVAGPHIGGQRRIGGTEVLEVDLAQQRGNLTMAGPAVPARVLEPAPAPISPEAMPAAAPQGEGTEAPDWYAAYVSNEYALAVEQAEAEGLQSILDGADVARVVALADAAKLAGRADLELRVLNTVRSRFSGTAAAADAALNLGRLARDGRGDVADAARWFRVAHDEGSDPTSQGLALGMHLQALVRLGDMKGAKRVAGEYLDAYPKGPHAALAEGLAPRRR